MVYGYMADAGHTADAGVYGQRSCPVGVSTMGFQKDSKCGSYRLSLIVTTDRAESTLHARN